MYPFSSSAGFAGEFVSGILFELEFADSISYPVDQQVPLKVH
jgi:hypothetical protein